MAAGRTVRIRAKARVSRERLASEVLGCVSAEDGDAERVSSRVRRELDENANGVPLLLENVDGGRGAGVAEPNLEPRVADSENNRGPPREATRAAVAGSSSSRRGASAKMPRAQQQPKWRCRRPRLRRACNRIKNRKVGFGEANAAEKLGQLEVTKVKRRLVKRPQDLKGVTRPAVARHAKSDERVVVRPDRATMVAERVESGMLGERVRMPSPTKDHPT